MKKNLFIIPANYNKSIVAFLIISISLIKSLYGQVNEVSDYRGIFGNKYEEALTFLNDQKWITDSLLAHKINPCFAKSVIFPELIRYSYIMDQMEVQALKTLYVQYGQQYANFSVGRFQIKPSFAEKLEADLKVNQRFKGDVLLKNIDTSQTPSARLERIKRLDSEMWQVQYLIWFINIMDQKYANLQKLTPENQVRFYATAYNCGYHYPKKYIEANMGKNYFHTAILNSQYRHNYSEISLYFWNNCVGKASF